MTSLTTASAVKPFIWPKKALGELRLGQYVEVWESWARQVIFSGEIVEIIAPDVAPNPKELEHHFAVNRRATALKQQTVPSRVSKYARVIVKGDRSGRCYVYPFGAESHCFLPGSTKEER